MESPDLNVLVARTTKMRWVLVVVLAVAGSVFLLYLAEELRPGSRSYRPPERSRTALMQAQQIWKACRFYAEDHDGRFPVGREGATHAFRELFPGGYLTDEKLFYVAGSAWHDEAPNKKPDDIIGAKPDWAQALERGENHWAYVSGLTTGSDPKLPLIADGFVEGEPGRYTDDPAKKGGCWRGTKAISVFVDGSAFGWPISANDGFRVMKSITAATGESRRVDVFSREGGLPDTACVFNPW